MKIKYNNKIYKQSKRKDLVILLFLLSFVVVCNLIIVSFSYFFNSQSATGTIKLAEVDFTLIEPQQLNLIVLPNVTISKTINIGNYRDGNPQDYKSLADIFLRYKVEVLLDEKQNPELTNSLNVLSDDNFYYDGKYYYYCGKIDKGKTINLCNKLGFDDAIDNKYQQKQIKLKFSVDAVQSEHGAYKEVWIDYPAEWEKTI